MKKKILPVVAAAFMCASAFAFGACTEGKPELDKVEAKPATCTENGNVEYYTDGTKYFLDADGTVEIPFADTVVNATGHSPKSEFSASGTQHWHDCSVCGDPTDAKTAHTPDAAWQTGDGKHWHNCSVCLKPVGEKQDHEFDWVIDRAATETTAGIKHEECECGEKRNENTEIPMIGATIPHERVEPTCGADGNIAYWEKDGKYYRDEDCIDEITLEDTVLTATGEHTQKSGFEKDGAQHWHVCSVCGNLIGEKQDHEFDWVIDRAATETTAGIKHEECECGEKRNENTEIPMIGATIPHERVEPTCGADGNIAYWEKDGKYYRDEDCIDEITLEDTVLTATGEHTSDNVWHSSDGKHWNECSVCRAHLNESDHDDAANIAWTDNGDEHVKTCSCSLILQREAHTYSDAVTEPTCTTGGFTAHTCVCGKSYIDGEVDALGHLPHESVYVPGEDGANGKFYSACPRCGDDGKTEVGVFGDRSVTVNGTVFSSPYDCYTAENADKGVTYDAINQLFVIHLDGEHFADTLNIVSKNNNVAVSVESDTTLTSFTMQRADFTNGVELRLIGTHKLTVNGTFPSDYTKATVACDLDVNTTAEGVNSSNDYALKFEIVSGTTAITQTGSGNCGFSLHRADDEITVGENARLVVSGFERGITNWGSGDSVLAVYGSAEITRCTYGLYACTANVFGTLDITSCSNGTNGANVTVGSEETAGTLNLLVDYWGFEGGSLSFVKGGAVIERNGDSGFAAFSGVTKVVIKSGFALKIVHMSTTAYGGDPAAEIDDGVEIEVVDMRDKDSAWLKDKLKEVTQ